MRFLASFINALRAGLLKQTASWTWKTGRTGYVNESMTDFVDKIRTPALAIEAVSGIPWRFAMTQAFHESAHGTSALARNAFNLFGVTADDVLAKAGIPETMGMDHVKEWLAEHPEVAAVIMKTGESSPYPPEKIRYWTRPGDIVEKISSGTGSDLFVDRPFRRYASWLESLQDWSARIQRRYPRALAAAKAGKFEQFAKALQLEGYATDQNYAAQLIALNSSLEGIA